MTDKPSRGRPSKGDEAKRFPLSIRTTRELKEQLEAAAVAADRSLAQEIETRLLASLNDKGPMPDETTAELLKMIATAIAVIERQDGSSWIEQLNTYTAVDAAIARLVGRRMPSYPAADMERLVETRVRHDTAMRHYERSLQSYQETHPDCPRRPDAEIEEWTAADQVYRDASERGQYVADLIHRPAWRHPGHINPDGTVTPVASLRRT